jgi:regulator of replication initiation timing
MGDLLEGQVFVYGYEVDDLHSLNKDFLFTINFAATQELDRQVQQLRTENTLLRTELQEMKHQLQLIVEQLSQ